MVLQVDNYKLCVGLVEYELKERNEFKIRKENTVLKAL